MKILWFTWKDKKHALAGGAEFLNEEIAKMLAADGHEVIFLVGGFPGCLREETVDGYRIIRLGNRWSVYWKAYRHYRKHLRGWADLIIEEVNTVPFLTQLYARKERRILFFHQLCREIWFYQMFFPVNIIGYLLEPLYLLMMRKNNCITVSESTRKDLHRFGFDRDRIYIIPECIEMEPLPDLESIEKFPAPTILSLGVLRSMKRTVRQIKAFELAKKDMANLRLIIAGDGNGVYRRKVLRAIEESPYRKDIRYLGRVDLSTKYELMIKSHLILVTSVKEGWGLTVTEAASQGTPAVVYNVDGLRDSVKDGYSGLVCSKNSPAGMASKIVEILSYREEYERMRKNAWELSKEYTSERCYNSFLEVLNRGIKQEESG